MAGTKVFVGNVPPMDEPTFRGFFTPYGNIADLVLNQTKRFGFVIYSTPEEAQWAINGLEGVTVNESGATFNLKLADNQGGPQPRQGPPAGNGFNAPMQQNGFTPMQQAPPQGGGIAKVFVGNVPPMDEGSFRSFFAPYGNIVDLLLNTNKRFGFVSFSSPQEAEMAINGLSGVDIGEGKTFNLKFADNQGPPGPSQPFQGQGKGGPPAHVIPAVYPNGFRADPYGGKGAPPPPAFPHPKGNGKGPSQRDEFLLPNMQQAINQAEPNSKLYVKGVPMYADDLFLYRVFAPFGAVLNAKCQNKEMQNYSVGFVQYNTAAEAQNAIAGVSGQPLTDGSVLEVTVKTAKGSGKGK